MQFAIAEPPTDRRSDRAYRRLRQSLYGHWVILPLLLVVLGSPFPSLAQSDDAAAYVAQLQDYSSGLSSALRLESESPGSSRQHLADLERRAPAPSWLAGELKAVRTASAKDRKAGIERALGLVAAYESAASGSDARNSRNIAMSRDVLQSVLKKAEYRPSPFDKFSRRVMDMIFGALEDLNVSEKTVRIFGWIIATIAVLVFAVLLVILILKLVAHFSDRQPLSKGADAKKHTVRRKSRPTVETLMVQAEQDASEENFREAFRNLYFASLLLLERARLLTYTDSGTNWEYLRALERQGAGETSGAFHRMTLVFDKLIYGKRDVTREDYVTCLQEFRRMEAAI